VIDGENWGLESGDSKVGSPDDKKTRKIGMLEKNKQKLSL
jgi:hypothetical protein